MESAEYRESWFTSELRVPADERRVDYASVESVLMRRIRECDQLGILGLLRIDEMQTAEKIDRLERDLFSQIYQHSEYDEPIEECLRIGYDLTEAQWDRFTAHLGERLQPVEVLDFWEQHILASCREPTPGHWEAIETLLFERISRSDERLQESWVRHETREEPVTAHALDTAEALLDEKIDRISSRPLWEQVLACEKIPPFSYWENAEDLLFTKLSKRPVLEIPKQPFWFLIEHYGTLVRKFAIAGAAAGVVIVAIAGFHAARRNPIQLPTVVYQLEGKAADTLETVQTVGGRCAMVSGGCATLVNSHGSIELRNRSMLNVKKLSKNSAEYQVRFSSARSSEIDGKVSFLVYPRNGNRNFSVTTADYRLVVKGTYFRVEEDREGKVATRVLEGAVRITDGPMGDTVLHAGQYLQYDPSVKRYRVFNGGPVVQRSEIENVPAIEELMRYRVISIRSRVEGVQVRIDGKYYGTTPLRLRQAEGPHYVRVSKSGYVTIDTMIDLTSERHDYRFTFTPQTARRRRADARSQDRHSEARIRKEEEQDGKDESRQRGAERDREMSARLYLEAQRAERADDWRNAITLYRQVYEDPGASLLRREDALFSIGKLQAENENDVEVAKESFITYLALFPSGTFAGESWLRLAELEFSKNPDNAIQYYLNYFRLFPRHPRIAELQDRVGVIYLQRKQYDKAIDMFEQALANIVTSNMSQKRDVAARLHRALLAKGDEQRAESVRIRYQVSDAK